MAATVAPAAPDQGTASATLLDRAGATLVSLISWIACRLPDRPLHRIAGLVGLGWYLLAPRRRAQARRNLRRVAEALAADGRASPSIAAAARDRRALERLVRDAFRHNARYYLEVALAPSYDERWLAERIVNESPELIEEAFAGGRGTGRTPGHAVIFAGLHFGAIELPAFFLTQRVGLSVVAPMETIRDTPLQRYFVRTRGAVGLRLVTLRTARREASRALARGEAVGLVTDRDITGGGIDVPLFGHPAPLAVGAGLLAIESGAPVYVAAVRRLDDGRYAGSIVPLPVPADGTRRERLERFLRDQAAIFESFIAAAPEQWWSVFFPIWPDLEVAS